MSDAWWCHRVEVVWMKYDVKIFTTLCSHHVVFEVEMKLGACGDALGPVVADKV